MCLIVFAYNVSPNHRLVVAANRDEFYERPTAVATFWEDCPDVLAGRDLVAGGTWLGITRTGRFAALTNYRGPSGHIANAPSRGHLVSEYLCGNSNPEEHLNMLVKRKKEYNGFNLLLGEHDSLWYFSNREETIRCLPPGIYGLSNHLLDTPWPKVRQSKAAFTTHVNSGETHLASLFTLLANDNRPEDQDLPNTGVGLEWERILSPAFITSPEYGTRSSTLMTISNEGAVDFTERTYLSGSKKTYVDSVFSLKT